MYIRALKPDEQAGIEAGFSLLECLYPVPEKPTQHPLDIYDSYPQGLSQMQRRVHVDCKSSLW